MKELSIISHKTMVKLEKDKPHRLRSLRVYGKSAKDYAKSNKQDEYQSNCTSKAPSCIYNQHCQSIHKKYRGCHIYYSRRILTSDSKKIPTLDSRIIPAEDSKQITTEDSKRIPTEECNRISQPYLSDNISLYHQQLGQQMTTCDYSCSGFHHQQPESTERCHLSNSNNRSWYLLLLPLLILLPDVDGGRSVNRIGVPSSPGPDTTTLLGPYEDKTVYPDPTHMFSQTNNTDIRTQVGATAVLHCRPNEVGENMVSWIRRRDFHLLTVGSSSYSSDQRFHVMYIKEDHDWQLHIRYVQVRDGGSYECQVSSHPPVSLFTNIQVLEATSEILGGPEKFMTAGSSLRLVCVLRQNTEEPSYVFWFHRDNMINYDTSREVKVENNGGLSVLFLSNVRPEDSGNYTCSPDNAQPSHINIQVLRGGETPAAIHSGSPDSWHSSNLDRWVIMLMLLLMLSINSGSSFWYDPAHMGIPELPWMYADEYKKDYQVLLNTA